MGLRMEHPGREEYPRVDTGLTEPCPFLVGGETPLPPQAQGPGALGTEAGDTEMVLPRAVAGHRLSVLGPAGGGGGGHEADARTSAAAASTAAAEAAIGGQRAGDAGGAGGAGLSHQHRASPGACAEQVPAAHDDLGPTQTGATDATRTDAAAREGDSAAGEGRAGDQGLRPTHQATAGAAHGCRRERSSVRLHGLHAPSVGWEVRALGGSGPYCLHSQYPLLLLSG